MAATPGTPSARHLKKREHVKKAIEAAQEESTLKLLQDTRAALESGRTDDSTLDPATAQQVYDLSYALFTEPENFKTKHVRRVGGVLRALKSGRKRAPRQADDREEDREERDRQPGCMVRYHERHTALKYSKEDGAAWVAECSEALLANMLDYYEHKGVFTKRLNNYRVPTDMADSFFSFPDADAVKIVIVGDVGSENRVRENVFRSIKDVIGHSPAAIVHLGDIYYCGRESECKKFLRGFNKIFDQSKQTLWSIPGNHEYLSFGDGFFKVIVSGETGKDGPASGNSQQRHSFFCLEYPQLKLILVAMDTGLNSWPDSHKDDLDQTAILHAEEAKWVRDKAEQAERKGYKLILCSHHQVTSAFSPKPEFFEELAHQALGSTTNDLLAWFWGHEHRLVVFDPTILPGVLPPTTYLKRIPHMECVGHGSIPTAMNAYNNRIFGYRDEFQPLPYRYREHDIAQNGFLVLNVVKDDPKGIEITHYDSYGKKTGGEGTRYLPGFVVK